MHERLLTLRDRALAGVPSSAALEEAFQELEVTREELTVADEELARSAVALAEGAAAGRGRLSATTASSSDGAPDGYAIYRLARHDPRRGNRTLATMLGVHPTFLCPENRW